MDELQMIATMLDEPPTQESEAAVRHRLLNGMRAPERPARRAWRRPGLWSGLGLVATATAVTGAVVLSSGTTPRAPDRPAASPVSARTVLLAAATKAEGAPAGHGRYWSAVTREGGQMIMGDREYYSVREIGLWDAGPGRHAWVGGRRVSLRDLGPAPAGGPVVSPGPGASVRPSPHRTAADGATPWTRSKVKGGEAFRLADWEGATAPDVRGLPADPQSLRRFLDRALDQVPGRVDSAEWLMSNAQKIGAAPVRPGVRAAMYRLLADSPGIRTLGSVTDPLGRRGDGVARQVRADDAVVEERLIIDPASGRLLAQESVLVKPGRLSRGAEPGTVFSYSALVSYGWTDKAPAYPVEPTG
ncbi:CU044_5270 family protein [Actinomadura sp. WMMA1423]|uniref:CU044_5270 family protein n=1 Tax=Actinomadura sp. WMMA1423 TaxID=2591108 RepID=UPI0011465647|nr:CU044_5270 family protein [Actinomadura sp. WMMA1423]